MPMPTSPTILPADTMKPGIETSSSLPGRPPGDRSATRWRIFWGIVYFLAAVAIVWFFVHGHSYYSTPLADRPHHPDYRQLRPAGMTGLGYGVVGSVMMIVMLVYTLRKRVRMFGRLGNLRQWLNFHMFLGVVGPLLIVLHTSFKVQGLVAISFWSMVLVAVSGFFGRFLYVQIPRNINGDALSLAELEQEMSVLTRRLRGEFGIPEDGLERIDKIAVAASTDHGLGALMRLIVGRGVSKIRVHGRVKAALLGVWTGTDLELRALSSLVHRKATIQLRTRTLGQVQQLFHYWHVFHKPFAIIMYIVMLVHIGVAVWTGYTWIF